MRTFASVRRTVLSLSVLLLLADAVTAGERKPSTGKKKRGHAQTRPLYSASDQARLERKRPQTEQDLLYDEMSSMGAIAAGLIPRPDAARAASALRRASPQSPSSPATIGSNDIIVHGAGDVGFQSETTIAANTTGTILIAGYNDLRGFSASPLSISGIARSTDGGSTWNEVPVGPGGLGVLPSVPGGQVFGDPDVKYDPVSDRFVYSSIYVRPSDGVQGLSIHVSTDGTGMAWSAPIEVTPAFVAGGAADKEFMDINRLTGRILITWTHFQGASATIRRTYSDDLGVSWAPVVTIAPGPGVQGSMPRFDPVTDNTDSVVYAVWRSSSALGRNVGCSRSTDGGVTWSAPIDIDTTSFGFEDQVVGVDRVHTFPALAIDDTTGRVYVVYQRNNPTGTGDVALRTFIGPCAAAGPALINSNPGSDRAQIYPTLTVDQSNGRVHAMWIDQDPETTGDLHEMMYSFSADAGTTWSRPTPLLDRPFRAGFGNDVSQPNIGDYNQNIAQDGAHYSLHGATSVAPRYDEGQPSSGSLFTPDTYFDLRLDGQDVVSLRLAETSFVESNCGPPNGNLDPGETGDFTLTLENYVGNATASATTITGISATLSTTTPGVTIGTGTSAYSDIAPLATAPNTTPITVTLAPSFTAGVYIDLLLTVTSAQGSTELPIRVPTGSPGITTTLINEDFQGVTAPALPAGWSSNNGCTQPTGCAAPDPWVTSTVMTPTNAVFHDNDGAQFEFMRLLSPVVDVPAVPGGVESYVTLDFDIIYRLEDEPTQEVLAYDGLTVRITDQTPGAVLRSVLAEAFAETITTGTIKHFPKHLPRFQSVNYFEDMSVWSGNSNGIIQVSMKFPGAGMAGRRIQLRFEYTEDSFGDCTLAGIPGPCGVAIDNIVLRHVRSVAPFCTGADLSMTKTDSPDPVGAGAALTYTLNVANAGPAPATNVVVTDTLPAGTVFVSASGTGWACGHASGTVTCMRSNLAVGPAPPITIQVAAPSTAGPINNTATVSADQTDPAPGNNSDTESTSVLSGPPGQSFFTVTPCRLADTRNAPGAYGGPPLSANSERTFVIVGQCSIPSTARTIAGNVTVTGSTSPIGDLRLRPGGTPPLSTSTINYSLGQTRANNVVVPLGIAGDIAVLCAGSPGTVVHFIFDVTGYFE